MFLLKALRITKVLLLYLSIMIDGVFLIWWVMITQNNLENTCINTLSLIWNLSRDEVCAMLRLTHTWMVFAAALLQHYHPTGRVLYY